MGVISDLNWKSLVKSGITSGLQSGLKGVGVAATKWVVAWGLNAAFGYQNPKEKEKEQLQTALKDINAELANIDNVVTLISQQLTALSNELGQDIQKVLTNSIEVNINTSISHIQSAWSKLGLLIADQGDAPSPRSQAAGSAPAVDETLKFANAVNGTWDIWGQALTISNGMVGGLESDNEGLLDTWTDTLILDLNSGTVTPRQAYGLLEQNFLTLMQWLYKAYTLCATASMRAELATAMGAGNLTDDQIHQKVQAAGQNFIDMDVTPALTALSQSFLQCAHRLMLSQYMRQINTSSPASAPNAFAPCIAQSDIQFCLARAYLVDWLMNQPEGGAENPGIIVSLYLRPTQVTATAGPSLTPGTGYGASTGKPFQLSGPYASNWYKVVDFSDAACTQLLDVSVSNVAIVGYIWSTPTPAVGTAVGSDGGFEALVPAYFDKATLDITSVASENTVIYGFGFDMSSITQNLVFNNADWPVTTSTPSSSTKDIKYVTWTPPKSGTAAGMPKSTTCGMDTNGHYKGPVVNYTVALARPIAFPAGSTAALYVYINGSASLTGYDYTEANGYAAIPWTASASISVGNAAAASASVDNPGNPSFTSNVAQTNSSATASFNGIAKCVPPPQNGDLVNVAATLTVEHQSGLKPYNGGSNSGGVSTTITLNSVIAAWPQPVVTS